MSTNHRRKILIISVNQPYPLLHGGAVAQYYFLKELSQLHNIDFCTNVQTLNEERNFLQLKKSIPGINLVYDSQRLGSGKSSILSSFQKKIHKSSAPKNRSENKFQLRHLSENYMITDHQFIKFLDNHLNNHSYDVIQTEFYETISLLPYLEQRAKLVFVYHELRSKRFELMPVATHLEAYKDLVIRNVKEQEKMCLQHADAVVVFNDDDKEQLSGITTKVIVSPYGIPQELITRTKPATSFERFLVLGNEAHLPNSEGLKWFLDEIYLPSLISSSWPVYVAGRWSSVFKEQYKPYRKIIFTGVVDSLDEWFDTSVLLSPLLSGSGIRTKVLQAFANWVPVIGTPIAVEGLTKGNKSQPHVLQFSTRSEFEDLVCRIKAEPSMLASLAINAHQFYQEYFSVERLVSVRNELYY